MDDPTELTPFELVGGEAVVRAISKAFYDNMETLEPALAQLHPLDADGRITRETRDRFALFFIGWLGGPQEYMARHGHPRLRMRHARVPIDTGMRDAWMRCMRLAMDAHPMSAEVRTFLDERLAHVADFLRNVPE
ncbi:MAG: group II truncated hemoglobin [Myxococcota bacterium]